VTTDGRERALAVAVLLVAVVLAPPRFASAWNENARDHHQDFGIFHRAAVCLAMRNCDPYALAERSAPNLGPPHAHLLLMPLVSLPVSRAYVLWLVISVAALAAVAVRICAELGWRLTPWPVLTAAALVASSGAAMSLVASGQIYAVLAVPITEAWAAWRRGTFTRAGVWIGIAASVKVLLLLPVLFFAVRGHWRAALAVVLTTAVIAAGGLIVFGVPVYQSWLTMLAQAPIAGHFRDGSVMAALTRTLDHDVHYAATSAAPWLVRPLWAVVSGLLVTIAIVGPRDRDRAFLAVLAASVLAAPIGWSYAIWWILGPAAAVWVSGSMMTRGVLTAAIVVMWLPDTSPLLGQPNPWLTPLWGSLFLWVWITCWAVGTFSRPLTMAARR
jgi:hypothetical protein